MDKETVIGTIFFASLVICGCGVDSFFDSPKSAITLIVAVIVAILCAIALGSKED